MKLGAKELRITRPTEQQLAKIKRRPIYIVLDNVLDTYNIGSLFRLADAIGAAEVILCGQSETPPSSRIHRAAVGTETWVPWRYFPTAVEFLRDFKGQIVAVEQDKRAVKLNDLKADLPLAVVVGHETNGVSPEILDLADIIVEIPMYGVNRSLNVHVSASIVLYKILELE